MAIAIEDVQTEIVETRGTGASEATPARSRAPDMDRICLELRRDQARLERLWTD